VRILLTDQTILSSVDADINNGNSHRKYHGNTAGANTRVAVIGQANLDSASPV